jgi:hypothetical protein
MEPTNKPDSGTIPFWDEWSKDDITNPISDVVNNWRMQSKSTHNSDT